MDVCCWNLSRENSHWRLRTRLLHNKEWLTLIFWGYIYRDCEVQEIIGIEAAR